jgi:hypothetical protein
MNHSEVNSNIREVVADLLSRGHKKTNIGKSLLGPSGYTQLLKFLDEDMTTRSDFGIKPLQKIANLLDCEVQIVFVDKEFQDGDILKNQNHKFINELKDGIANFLSENTSGPSIHQENIKRRTKLDDIIDEVLEEEV